METNEAWRAHEPVWAKTNDPDFPDERALSGCTCGGGPAAESYGPSWMAEHLAERGAPDYMHEYWKRWATHVEAPKGSIDRDAVARELSDFSFIMEQVSTVYSELADLSKPNYHAQAILGVINDRQEKHYREHYAERLCEQADDTEQAEVRAVLMEMAEEWSPGAWDEYRRDREMIERMQAAKAT